jgi:hypothetical protein
MTTNLEGNDHYIIEILSWNFSGGTEKTTKTAAR